MFNSDRAGSYVTGATSHVYKQTTHPLTLIPNYVVVVVIIIIIIIIIIIVVYQTNYN